MVILAEWIVLMTVKVCRAEPIFTKYEDHWPITMYVEDWFRSIRAGSVRMSPHYRFLRRLRTHQPCTPAVSSTEDDAVICLPSAIHIAEHLVDLSQVNIDAQTLHFP